MSVETENFLDRLPGRELFGRMRAYYEPPSGVELGTAAVLWTNPGWSAFCALFLIGALFHPVEGLPFRLCLFYSAFGVDCPACGMTRGLSHLWHGNLGLALGCHLLSPLAFAYLVWQAGYLILTPRARAVTIAFLNRYDRGFRGLWYVGMALFLAYGGCRAGLEWMQKGFACPGL